MDTGIYSHIHHRHMWHKAKPEREEAIGAKSDDEDLQPLNLEMSMPILMLVQLGLSLSGLLFFLEVSEAQIKMLAECCEMGVRVSCLVCLVFWEMMYFYLGSAIEFLLR